MHRWHIALLSLGLTGCTSPPAPSTESAPVPAPSPAPAPTETLGAVNTATFWRLVGEARSEAGTDDDAFLDALAARLDALPAEAVADFDHEFNSASARAYRWDLWGAAYAILGGCSDDGFEYFRAWLVAQGEAVFNAAVADPDSLADRLPLVGEAELEMMLSVASDVYERKTGGFIPPRLDVETPSTELGEEWDFDDDNEMSRRLPRLTARLAEG